jgi:hypothetical protein
MAATPASQAATPASQYWWSSDPSERFWLEITDRDDVGVDLNAPAESETGRTYWSYAFVREVAEGDIVLHYRARPINSITHWSRAVGEPYIDQVHFGAHGQGGGRGPVDPYWRPGWRRPLDGPYALPEPVSHAELRELEAEIRAVHLQMLDDYSPAPIYFPFQLSDTRPLRAFQGYLTKFPRALVSVIPQLSQVEALAARTSPTSADPAPTAADKGLGAPYRHANPGARTARREPFSVDPDLVDRALRRHATTQEALWAAAGQVGLSPRSPNPGEPQFDIAWEDGDEIVVAEVKSLTEHNEEKQLRLAMGQVLRYGHLLAVKGRPVRCVIAAERQPSDASWGELCEATGVDLVWPATFASLFAPGPPKIRSGNR